MTADLLDAFVPCETFEVTVQYGPEEVLSPLEIEVIYAINSGFDTLPALVDLYRLGNRPMFDLVSGLWKAGHIYVNLHNSTLHVKESVEKQIREKNLEALNRTEIREKSFILMQELVTGAVLPLMPQALMRNTYRIVPQLIPFGSYREIPPSRIVDLVVRQSLRRSEEARSFKVLHAYLQPRVHTGGGPSVSRRLMQLRMHYGVRHGRPVVEVASPITIDGQIRRQLEEAIGLLAQERPEDPFSRHLLERAWDKAAVSSGTGSTKTLENLLADLERRIDVLRGVKAEEHQVRHQALQNIAELALEAMRRRRARRARARLLGSPQDTAKAIEVALSLAKSQIVLCSPRATWTATAPYWDSIERAVVGGASLFLLWGESRQSVPDKVLERNLIALAERNDCADRVHWNQTGLGTNESFLVTDRQLATLATFSLLDEPRAIPDAGLAVQFEALGGCECEAITALLDRVRRNSLDHAQAQALELYWVAEGRENDSEGIPTIPDEPGHQGTGAPICTESSLYVEAWQAFARELRLIVERLGDCVEMIFDGSHRQVLMQALEDRPSNIVLASRSISPDAITTEVVGEVNACVNRGAQVSIAYNTDRHNDERTSERLSTLGGRGERLHVRRLATSGGVVATDAFALLSGFPLLGLPGFLLQESGQRRLEAGVLVYGAGFARQVADALGHRTVAQGDVVAKGPADSVAANGLDSHDLRALQALTSDVRAATATGDTAPLQGEKLALELVLRQAASLALDAGRWKLFGEWVRRLDAGLASRAVATLLVHAAAPDSREIREWQIWLARDRWLQHRYVETAVLMAGMEAGAAPGVPTFGMAKAAAACGMPRYTGNRADLLVEAMEDGADADRAVSWICVASIDLLVHGVPDAAAALGDLATRAPALWADWSRSLVTFWEAEGQAVPMERFEALRQGFESLDQKEQARQHVNDSIAILAQVMQGFHFTLGRRAWDDLSGPRGWIGAIRDIVDRKDAESAARWVSRLTAEKADHESILVEVEHRVYSADPPGVGNKHIEGTRRTRCLAALRQVIDAARNWVEKTPEVADGGAAHYMEGKARALGVELRAQIAAIEADPGHVALNVARPLYETMKKKLEILWTQS